MTKPEIIAKKQSSKKHDKNDYTFGSIDNRRIGAA
jgi:hypothetical protein